MRIAPALLSMCVAIAGAPAFAAHNNEIVEGNPASPVKIIIYEDLQSAHCARFRAMLDEKILPKYGARVAFIHRDFPLGKHDWARQAAVAARWVWEQDRTYGIAIRRELLAEQDHITLHNLPGWLQAFAARNNLDEKGIVDSLTDERLNTLIIQDRQSAVARGVTLAPTVYARGTPLIETILYDDLARELDEALSKF